MSEKLSAAAIAELATDRQGVPLADPGSDAVIVACIDWLCTAQDHSTSADGGVARDFSLVKGWASSYPETTGYIIATMIEVARRTCRQDLRRRAQRMLDWCVAIQFPEGGFQGGKIDSEPRVPVTFNTGQILLGLASGVIEFGDRYREAMYRAADWLASTQDSDGCWRRHPTPFARPGEKTYETHVAWGLLEAARLAPDRRYDHAALANVRWAITQQESNGWLAQCCLSDPSQPLTHTLGYALRGFTEAYRYSQDREFLDAATRTADGLLCAMEKDGFLAGRLRPDWSAAVEWTCLTGTAQVAHSWLMLYQFTGSARYREAAYAANRYVRRTIKTGGRPETRGGVKGSFPIDGAYGKYEYLNWACKFCIDANLIEENVRLHEAHIP